MFPVFIDFRLHMMNTRLSALPLLAALTLSSFAHLRAGEVTPGLSAAASQSAIEPAVSSLNGKLEGSYGAINRSSTRGVAGALSAPLGQRFGAQLDGLYQHGFSTNIFGVGGHLFARDPGKGLIGLTFGGMTSQKFTDVIVGMEGEYYFKHLTLGLVAGYDNFDAHAPTSFPGLATHRDFVATRVYAAIYPMDDLMVRLEHQSRFNHHFYIAHVEWQTPVKGVALFADGGIGDANYAHLMGGVRIYFGGSKSLKDRHRKDDPDNINTTFIGTSSSGGGDSSQAGGANGAPRVAQPFPF